ncbi:uncharacterized protein BP01DRAFT_62922 [Aspergillus saccharolyticus JOP 1030-1]|uniref:Transmembrane protein n=1 Tax=Aspergillus saccharolyticus JOP 1030-1 TaxID=1450539 RepID=A0A319ADP4_9EURO|nr:hypothetical protein BP01DRAFT_62922 [Aspergillus saccharolyticus JOP 1030-1]PYH44982.1 hypothetical protein BP01DRAFT_62922 [Aspergillus saccharolyticus JOP 1030-1]
MMIFSSRTRFLFFSPVGEGKLHVDRRFLVDFAPSVFAYFLLCVFSAHDFVIFHKITPNMHADRRLLFSPISTLPLPSLVFLFFLLPFSCLPPILLSLYGGFPHRISLGCSPVR